MQRLSVSSGMMIRSFSSKAARKEVSRYGVDVQAVTLTTLAKMRCIRLLGASPAKAEKPVA